TTLLREFREGFRPNAPRATGGGEYLQRRLFHTAEGVGRSDVFEALLLERSFERWSLRRVRATQAVRSRTTQELRSDALTAGSSNGTRARCSQGRYSGRRRVGNASRPACESALVDFQRQNQRRPMVCTMFKEHPFMKATFSELLMRNRRSYFCGLGALSA